MLPFMFVDKSECSPKIKSSTSGHVCPHRNIPASKIENILAHVLMPRVINLENLNLIPSQVATYLGILYASPCHQTRGRLMVTNWLSIIEGCMASDESPPAYKLSVREWTRWRMQAKIKGCSHVRQDICCSYYRNHEGQNCFRWAILQQT